MVIKFKRLTDTAILPTQAHDTDAGIDLYSDETIDIKAHSSAPVRTGIAWNGNGCEFDCNSWEFYRLNTAQLIVKSRSGMAFKKGIEASNAGVIDQDYTGEINVLLYNTTDKDFTVNKGDKIAQAVFEFKPKLQIVEVKEIEKTVRGDNGFGSSGF